MHTKPTHETFEQKVEILEGKLNIRVSFEALIKSISASLINMTLHEIDNGIAGALEMISQHIGAEKSGIFRFSEELRTLTSTHTWPPAQFSRQEIYSTQELGHLWEKACRKQFVAINDIADLPGTNSPEHSWFESNGSRPLLLIPMVIEKRIYGLLTFSGKSNEPKEWQEVHINLIGLIADRFTNALYRKQSELDLINSKNISEALLNATTDSAMLLTPAGTILAINTSFSKRLEKTSEELIGKNVFDHFSGEVALSRKAQIDSVIKSGKPVQFEDDNNGLVLNNIIYPVFGALGRVDRLAFYSHDITDLKCAEKNIRFLTNELIKAQENERHKIACDLHDNVAQELASLRICCDALSESTHGISPNTQKKLAVFSKSIKHSIDTVRSLAYELQPPNFDQMGLVRTLYRYCEEFTIKYGINVDFYSAGLTDIKLSFDAENNIHRIVQEALNNVRAHSNAGQVIIRMVATYPNIILRIEDNGNGFDVEKSMAEAMANKRMGLKSIEGRVQLQNGKFKIISKKKEGTRIFIEMPINDRGAVTVSEQIEEYYPMFKEQEDDSFREE